MHKLMRMESSSDTLSHLYNALHSGFVMPHKRSILIRGT